MKGCEPRDLLDRVTDLCLFAGDALELSPEVIDVAWSNYFGTSHSFSTQAQQDSFVNNPADPLEL